MDYKIGDGVAWHMRCSAYIHEAILAFTCPVNYSLKTKVCGTEGSEWLKTKCNRWIAACLQ